jgi:serine/threonine-protein kinase
VAQLLEECCSALAAAHGRGIVHRDLKPGNIFVVQDSQDGTALGRYVKLLDFGLAKSTAAGSTDKSPTLPGTVVGTPDYLSPEQARGAEVSARTDLYSLGVMAFEMLTGTLPFVAPTVVELLAAHVQAPPPRVRSRASGVPESFDRLVFGLMAKKPEDRPPSAEAVRRALGRIREELGDREMAKATIRIPLMGEDGRPVLETRPTAKRVALKTPPKVGPSKEQLRVLLQRALDKARVVRWEPKLAAALEKFVSRKIDQASNEAQLREAAAAIQEFLGKLAKSNPGES